MTISPKNLVGTGIFTWDGAERRSNRYGSFTLTTTSYDASRVSAQSWRRRQLNALDGRRVIVTCVVKQARKSGHTGDVFLGVSPMKPKPGEVVTLGIGRLFVGSCSWEPDSPALEIQPSIPRDELWLDPRILYRLHDQTVDVHLEETDAPDLQRACRRSRP